ncbi:MAG: HD domain-containing protein, partial [Ignavibacteriae bacterium]|nr:HD domain-containing protein [Ignavibacteriota bacterium]
DRYNTFGQSPKVLEPNVKFTAGGLRDIHTVEWLHSIKNKQILSQQYEVTHTERFIEILFQDQLVNYKAKKRLIDGYRIILQTRNLLHLTEGRKIDRLEFSNQKNIALRLGYDESTWKDFMFKYFESATILNRFSKTMMKRYRQEIAFPLSDYLNIKLDDDFQVKGKILSFSADRYLSISEIMRAFFYRAVNDASFEKNLRALIIESTHIYEETEQVQTPSSVFFRELLKLPANVGKTLSVMNEFGFLGIFLKEFKDLVGFFQPGVYHCYTTDEHTLIAMQNVEMLNEQNNNLSKIFKYLPAKDVLYMAILLHDIGKPISDAGHEIIGAEISISVMERLGFGQKEIEMVKFLVKHHLRMEKVAFRRNLNDPETLDKFVKLFPSVEHLDLLYLLTYGDLSAVSPVIWTQWKEDLLNELYTKTKSKLEARLSGGELIYSKASGILEGDDIHDDSSLVEYLEQLDDEIDLHIAEFEKDTKFTVFVKNTNIFTNVTVIAKDSESLLASLCGVLSINELYIHDAKIFTRKDSYVINSFNVTDFKNHEIISETNHNRIEKSLLRIIDEKVQFEKEFEKANAKWKKLEKVNFRSEPNVKFEDHERFTIIDVHSHDRVGLLYQLTHKMVEMGLTVYFAKISTKVDEVVDTFYVLKNDGKKILKSEFEFIKSELLEAIS